MRSLWESMGLVAHPVFKTAEAFARGLVGSIPTLSRQDAPCSSRSRDSRVDSHGSYTG